MNPSSPPLIARLRRRLSAWVWLGALLILLKVGVAAACFGDGPQEYSAAAAASAAGGESEAAADVPPVDDSSPACWHAGAGGCHCGCVHGSALPVAANAWSSSSLPRIDGILAIASPVLTPREPALRPPIA